MFDYTDPTVNGSIDGGDDDKNKKNQQVEIKVTGFEDEKGNEIKPETQTVPIKIDGFETEDGKTIATPQYKATKTKINKVQTTLAPRQQVEDPTQGMSDEEKGNYYKHEWDLRNQETKTKYGTNYLPELIQKAKEYEGKPEYADINQRIGELDRARQIDQQNRLEVYRKVYGKDPEAGFVNPYITPLDIQKEDSGLNLSNVAPTVAKDENGQPAINGISNTILIDASKYDTLQGQDFRDAFFGEYASKLGGRPDENKLALEADKLIFGPEAVFQDFSTGKGINNAKEAILGGMTLPNDKGENLVKYEDPHMIVAKLVMLSRMAKIVNPNATAEDVKRYYNNLKETEDKFQKDLEASKRQETQGWEGDMNSVLNALDSVFGQKTPDISPIGMEGYKGSTTEPPREINTPEYQTAMKQLLGIERYEHSLLTNQEKERLAQVPNIDYLGLLSPFIYGTMKVTGVDKKAAEYLPNTATAANTVGALLPFVVAGPLGEVGTVAAIGLTLNNVVDDTRTLNTEERNKNLAIQAVTLTGLSALGKLAPIIGSPKAATGQAAIFASQAVLDYTENSKAFENDDGTFNWAKFSKNFVIPAAFIFQSGLGGIKTLKHNYDPVPNKLVNVMLVREGTGDKAMMVQHPDTGAFYWEKISPEQVDSWVAEMKKGGREYLIREIPAATFDTNLTEHGNPVKVKNLWKAITGKKDNSTEFAKQNILNQTSLMGDKTSRKGAIPDENNVAIPVRSSKFMTNAINNAMNSEGREYSILKAGVDLQAPLNIYSNLLYGDSETVPTLRRMAEKDLLKIDDRTGQVTFNPFAREVLADWDNTRENFLKTIEKAKSDFGFGDQIEEVKTEEGAKNPLLGADFSKKQYTLDDISGMSENKRQALALAILRGDGVFDKEVGVFQGKNYKAPEIEPIKVPEAKVEASASVPESKQKAEIPTNFKESDFNFRVLDREERLGKPEQIILKNKENGNIHILERNKLGVYNDKRPDSHFIHKSIIEIEKAVKDGQYLVGERVDTSKPLTMQEQKIEDASGVKLPEEVHTQNEQNYNSRSGEVRVTPSLTIDTRDKEWDNNAKPYFVQDPENPNLLMGNKALVDLAGGVRGVAGFANSRVSVLRTIANAINDTKDKATQSALGKLSKAIESMPNFTVAIARVSPDSRTYRELRTSISHEKTHSIIMDAAGSKILPVEVYEGIFGTKHGKAIKDILSISLSTQKDEKGNPVPISDQSIAHEVIAYGTEQGGLGHVGLHTADDLEAFFNTYADLLNRINSHFGADIHKQIQDLANPKLTELTNTINEYENNKLQRLGQRPEDTTGAGARGTQEGIPETSQPYNRLPETTWRGSGLKEVSAKRFTPTGEFDSYTNYPAEETKKRIGGKRTFNFYVAKPDGTFLVEPVFKGLPEFKFDGHLNLLDMAQDAEASRDYNNMNFADFQAKYENQYHGFFSSRDDLPDAYKYRMAVFDNPLTRAMLSGDSESVHTIAKDSVADVPQFMKARDELLNKPEYKDWAYEGDYKPILDENGKPLIVFRGTPKDTPTLDYYQTSYATEYPKHKAYFFAKDPEYANGFTGRIYHPELGDNNIESKPHIIPAVLRAKNPYEYGQNINFFTVAEFQRNINTDGRYDLLIGYDSGSDRPVYVALDGKVVRSPFAEFKEHSSDSILAMKAKNRAEVADWGYAEGYKPIVDENGDIHVLYHGVTLNRYLEASVLNETRTEPIQWKQIENNTVTNRFQYIGNGGEFTIQEGVYGKFHAYHPDAGLHGKVFDSLKEAQDFLQNQPVIRRGDPYYQAWDKFLAPRGFVSLATHPKTSEIFSSKVAGTNNGFDQKSFVFPLIARARKVWDYENQDHRVELANWVREKFNELEPEFIDMTPAERQNISDPEQLKRSVLFSSLKSDVTWGTGLANEINLSQGSWISIESLPVQEFLKEKGYDAFTTFEGQGKNYHLYDTKNIRSPFAQFKDYDADRILAMKSQQSPAGFYSPTEEAFLQADEKGKLPNIADGKDWLNKVKSLTYDDNGVQRGIKQDELDWMGLDSFLNGRERVSKEDVQNYIQNSKVTVVQKQYGGRMASRPELLQAKTELANLQKELDNLNPKIQRMMDESAKLPPADIKKHDYVNSPEYARKNEILDRMSSLRNKMKALEPQGAQWSEYSLGGEKKNPVEIALTIPNLEKGSTSGEDVNVIHTFESPHNFPDNTIVHIRGDERTLVSGEDAFNIGEIQSDLHQKGKNEGYRPSIEDAQKTWKVERKESDFPPPRSQQVYVHTPDGQKFSLGNRGNLTDEKLIQIAYENKYETGKGEPYYDYNNDADIFDEINNDVPDAPFKDTAWMELAFKKAVRYAAENGFKKITWTTGKQQIDMNETALRKNVKKIDYVVEHPLPEAEVSKIEKENARRYELKRLDSMLKGGLTEKERNELNTLIESHKDRISQVKYYDPIKSPQVTITVHPLDGATKSYTLPLEGKGNVEFQSASLDQLLGKKMADEVRTKGTGSFEGEGLSIGGQMHKFIYDTFLPNYAKKFGKKWGAEVGTEKLKTSELGKDYIISPQLSNGEHVYRVFSEGTLRKSFKHESDAIKYAEKEFGKIEELHSMTIPDAMRESVQLGLPQFAKEVQREQENWVNRLVDPPEVRQDRLMKSYYATAPQDMHVEGITNIVKGGNFSNISAVKEGMTPEEAVAANASLKKDLEDYGLKYIINARGIYNGIPEDSFLVYYPNESTNRIVQYFSNKYGQESGLHGVAGKYWLEFQDGARLEQNNIDFSKTKDTKKDGTYVELPDGIVRYNIDFGSGQSIPAPQGYSLKNMEVKIAERKNLKDSVILTPEDIQEGWNKGLITNARGEVVNDKTVTDAAGVTVGKVEVDDMGREVMNRKGKDPVYFIDGIGKSGKETFYKGMTNREMVGATGMFQELVKLRNEDKPDYYSSKENKDAYKIRRAEIINTHIQALLDKNAIADPEAIGNAWYGEGAKKFAERVGRTVEDVNNDVVKLWLWLTTGATSRNTSVKPNAQFAANAIASIVRFYKHGELFIPKFQYNNDGTVDLKADKSPKKLGLGSAEMEKLEMLANGYIPANSMEGFSLQDAGGTFVKSKDVLKNPVDNKITYIKSPTAQAMMEKHGSLQGVINFLLSPSVDGKKFNKAVDIMGDKVGAFFSNLAGLTQIPTIDTWMNRYLMGLTGDAIEVKRDRQGRIKNIKDNSLKFDPVEGDFFRGVIQKATEDYNSRTGQNYSPSDVQAIIWTHVKAMYNSLSRVEKANIDFSDAYSQIEAETRANQAQGKLFHDPLKNKELPSAPHNEAITADTATKSPLIRQLTESDWGQNYGARYFIDADESGALFMKSVEGDAKKKIDLDVSDPLLQAADFDSWIALANSRIKNSALSDSEVSEIKRLSDNKDVGGLTRFVLRLDHQNVAQLLANVWRVNPLVGVRNLLKNTIGNTTHQLAQEIARIPAFMMDIGLSKLSEDKKRTITAPSLVASAKGVVKGITVGIPDAWRVLSQGSQDSTFENPSLFRDKTTGIWALKPLELYTKYGFRLQEAADRPFKAAAYYRSLEEAIKLHQKNYGLTYEEAKNELTLEDYDKAYEDALFMTFQSKNKVASEYYKYRERLAPTAQAILDTQIKYVKTPLNVVSRTLDFTGFFPLLKLANKNFSHQQWGDFKDVIAKTLDTPEDRSAISWAFGRGLVGWGLGYIGYALAQKGIITPFYDREDKSDKELQGARGLNWGSVQVGGYNFEISSVTPAAFFMLSGATYAIEHKKFEDALNEAIASGDQTKIDKVLAENPTGSSITKSLKNLALQTPVVNQAVNIYDNSYSTTALVNTLIGANTFVPAIVGEAAKIKDRKERVIESSSIKQHTIDTVQSMIPSWRESLPVKYDMLGREIEAPYGGDPFKTTKVSTDPLLNELSRFNIALYDNTKGTSVERNAAKGEKGRYFEPVLRNVINTQEYQLSPDDVKKKTLLDVIRYVSPEFKKDKFKPEEETFNINSIVVRNAFSNQIVSAPQLYSRGDRVITDEGMLKDAAKIGMKTLNVPKMYEDLKKYKQEGDEENGLAAFIKNQFTHKLMVGKNTTLEEANQNFNAFRQDPEMFIIKSYLNQKEYEERQPRLKARREELIKQGKTESEINDIMAKDRRAIAKRNKDNKITSLPVQGLSKPAGLQDMGALGDVIEGVANYIANRRAENAFKTSSDSFGPPPESSGEVHGEKVGTPDREKFDRSIDNIISDVQRAKSALEDKVDSDFSGNGVDRTELENAQTEALNKLKNMPIELLTEGQKRMLQMLIPSFHPSIPVMEKKVKARGEVIDKTSE